MIRELGIKTQMIKEDVSFLLDAGLLEQIDEPDAGFYVFRTTEKGKEALRKFYQLVSDFFA